MEPFKKLAAQLSQLFELEKADLDFGIHRIIKARQKHIRVFLGLDEPPADDPGSPTLKKIVQREMGELNTVELGRQLDATAEKIKTNYGQLAFNSGVLTDGPAKESGDGQLWMTLKEGLDSGEEKANAQLEAEIYSHLTEFFSRYYDEADFLSKRRIKAGDAPYAVPYSGEEVMLHWANKDQYYIKSSKDLKDYTFTLPDQFGGKRIQFKCERQDPVLNNNNAKREFHLDLDADGKPQIETSEDGDGRDALVIRFHFKIVDKTRTAPETKAWIEHLLELLPSDEWRVALSHVPEGAKTNLITRHLNNYTRKNEADFFIHKQLGKFLRGELDFYIKNEVMHLDDIDEKSTDYLTTRVRLIKALRTIAQHIIRFLAQLENFQKKLWLKKKYVTETQYCFTLDRVLSLGKQGEVLLDTLLNHVDDKIRRYDGEMRSQHDEWIKLYAIDELEDYPKDGKLTAEFLRTHDKLMLDTVFYPAGFKWQLLGAMDDLEEQLDGLLIHSENFQALNLLQDRYREKVKCVYIDPPYNTDATPINYKNGFKDSSWLALCQNSLGNARQLTMAEGIICVTIDDVEVTNLRQQIETSSPFDELGTIAIKNNPAGRTGTVGFSICHEYAIFCGSIQHSKIKRLPHSEEQIRRYKEVDDVGRFEWTNFRKHGGQNTFRTKRPRQFYPIYAQGEKIRIPEMNWDNKKREYEILESPTKDEETLWPIDNEGRERIWDFIVDTARKEIPDLRVRNDVKGNTAIYRKWRINSEGLLPSTIWDKSLHSAAEYGTNFLTKLFGETHSFSFPKSIHAVSDCLIVAGAKASPCSITLDYFAGSGTTGHAVINLNREDNGNRNYILVEMGDHFDTVLKPRIQKVVYSADWKGGKPKRVVNGECGVVNDGDEKNSTLNTQHSTFSGISHGFKYLRLESYEDALNNLDLGKDRAPDLLGLGDQVREDFLFSYLLDVETRGHLLNLDRFRDPWGCQLKIHDPHTGRGEARVVDLVETFHYLLGVTVREIRIQGTKDQPDAFLTIEGENPDGKSILIIWRRLEANPDVEERHKIDWPMTDNADLKAFAATHRGTARGLNPADTEFHAIYINGDHTLADPNSKIHCIEEVFYERMFANTGNPED